MRSFGSLLLSILFAVVVIWLLLKLLGAAFKLAAVGIGLVLAVVVYLGAKKMIGKAP